MKYRIHQSKSSIFLMELIIVILFFALTGAVCLQIFVKARSISNRSKAQTHAVMWAENLAEVFLGCEGDIGTIGAVLNREYNLDTALSSADTGGIVDFYVNDDWNLCDTGEASFRISLFLDGSDAMHKGQVNIFSLDPNAEENDEPLYSLTFQKYVPENAQEGGNAE